MRCFPFAVLFSLLTGCAVIPPDPPECKGEFQPLNVQQLSQGAYPMDAKESAALCQGKVLHVG